MKRHLITLFIREIKIKITMRYHFTQLEWPEDIITNVGKAVGKWEPSSTASENIEGTPPLYKYCQSEHSIAPLPIIWQFLKIPYTLWHRYCQSEHSIAPLENNLAVS